MPDPDNFLPADLETELASGYRLSCELVDHLTRMGNAERATIRVFDRAKEMVVIVMTKEEFDQIGLKP